MKFQSRPKVIEAEQFFVDKKPWPAGVVWDIESETGYSVHNDLHNSKIKIKSGDWVRTDAPGDLYPIDADYMKANYEPVRE